VAAEIAVDEALSRVAGGTYLLDVREQDEWDRGHAPTAHLIPMSVIQERVAELPEGEPLLVICHSGYRSYTVTKALVAAGYDAASVAGGMEAWQSAGGEVVQDTSQPPLA
jgi:rhodanese-related sulfurtransferase